MLCRVGVSATVVVTLVRGRNSGIVQVQFSVPACSRVVRGWGVRDCCVNTATMKEYRYCTGTVFCTSTHLCCAVWGVHTWWGKPGAMKEYWYCTGTVFCTSTHLCCAVWGVHAWWGKPGAMKEHWYCTGTVFCTSTHLCCAGLQRP